MSISVPTGVYSTNPSLTGSSTWHVLTQTSATVYTRVYTTDAVPVEEFFDLIMNVVSALIFGIVFVLGIAGLMYVMGASKNSI